MKIAICDDDVTDLEATLRCISKYDAGLACDTYGSAVALIDALKTTFYDIIFLDIEMHTLNGFDAAKQIMAGKEKPRIIFVTNSTQYTIQGYGVAFRYLVKPISAAAMEEVLTAAFEDLMPRKIALEIGGVNTFFDLKDIYYFEVFSHTIKIITETAVFSCRNSLKNIEELLLGSSFLRPHNSFVVNAAHVVSASQADISMRDGRKIAISRKRKDEVFRALYQYLRR